MKASTFFVALAFCACAPSLDGKDRCLTQADCLSGYFCVDEVCGLAAKDAGTDPGPAIDAGALDAGPLPFDAGTFDAGAKDAGTRDAGPIDDGCRVASDAGAPFTLRAVAANLTSGNAQSYDPGEGKRILTGLRPDIVMLQEFNIGGNTPAAVSAFANAIGGVDAGMYVARGLSGSIPNGIVSRWPIIASGDWVDPKVDNRSFTWAQIDLPGSRDVWVVSLHLLTSNATDRNAEGTALISELQAKVPAADFLIIGGDLNTDSRTEVVLTTLGARITVTPGQPADGAGKGNTNATRSKPYDWVLPSSCLVKHQVPVQIGTNAFTNGLVVDTRVYSPIADLAPALATESAATNMQHMAVVKDFVILP